MDVRLHSQSFLSRSNHRIRQNKSQHLHTQSGILSEWMHLTKTRFNLITTTLYDARIFVESVSAWTCLFSLSFRQITSELDSDLTDWKWGWEGTSSKPTLSGRELIQSSEPWVIVHLISKPLRFYLDIFKRQRGKQMFS